PDVHSFPTRRSSDLSWIVLGRGMAVTAVIGRYQCAETLNIALGLGSAAPRAAHARAHPLSSIAFIGFPWPKKIAGIKEGSCIGANSVEWEEDSSRLRANDNTGTSAADS